MLPAQLAPLTRAVLIATLTTGFLHHADHVLRVDHSGWPFVPRVTAFTYSLLAYPVFLLALYADRVPLALRTGLIAAAAAFTLYAHTQVESPYMQWVMWAENCSADPAAAGITNLFDIRSPVIGYVAAGISLALNALIVAGAALMAADTLRQRRRPGRAG